MNYNEKEVKVTLKNDTIKIAISNGNFKFPFTDVYKAAKFLATEFGGTKKEAAFVLKLQDTDVSQD